MAYWLVKSEPSVYPWTQLVKEKKTTWDGIRNHAARLHLLAMRKGDEVMFYHSNAGLDIVGIARVSREAFRDMSAEDERWVAVELAADRALKKPVSLADMKQVPELAGMSLIRIGRLSVHPITEKEWSRIIQMSES